MMKKTTLCFCIKDDQVLLAMKMRPLWYCISNLPFEEMWAADAKWIPLILAGEKIEAEVNFNADGSAVKSFDYESAEF